MEAAPFRPRRVFQGVEVGDEDRAGEAIGSPRQEDRSNVREESNDTVLVRMVGAELNCHGSCGLAIPETVGDGQQHAPSISGAIAKLRRYRGVTRKLNTRCPSDDLFSRNGEGGVGLV